MDLAGRKAGRKDGRKEMPLNEWPIWTVWEICIIVSCAVTKVSVL